MVADKSIVGGLFDRKTDDIARWHYEMLFAGLCIASTKTKTNHQSTPLGHLTQLEAINPLPFP